MKFAAFLLVAICGTAPCYAGLVAHYALNGDAVDSSGNGLNGTLYGATATTDRHAVANSALFFDGLDDYVDIGQQLLFNGDDFTIAFWAKSAGNQNQYSVMVSQGHWGTGGDPESGFAFQYGFPNASDTIFIFGNTDSQFQWNTLSFPTDLEQDVAWHHYAVTKSGNVLAAYFDGAYVAGMVSDIEFETYDFNIGRDFYNTDANHRTFYGAIDDVYVFDSALSQSEIEQLQLHEVPEPASLTILLTLGSAFGICLQRRQHRKRTAA